MFRFHPDSDSESKTSSSSDNNNNNDNSDPNCARPQRRRRAATEAALVPLEVADVVSQIPSRCTLLTMCLICLDSIIPILPSMQCGQQQQQSLLLRGIVCMCNIAYEKRVVVRYTFDDWKMTSKMLAHYVDPGPAGQGGAHIIDPGDGAWDQFTFTIPLMLRVPPGDLPCTLLLAVCFTAPGEGEWWDNNRGDNFCVLLSQRPCGVGSVTVTVAGHHHQEKPPMIIRANVAVM
jgi:hypothetical protein